MHFRGKNYKKGKYPFEDNCKYIAYFLEKEYTFSLNKPIVLLFDMNGAGMSGAVRTEYTNEKCHSLNLIRHC